MEAFYQKYRTKLQDKSALGENRECIIWTGTSTPNGKYGIINCRFPGAIGWKSVYVHRLAYMIEHQSAYLPAVDVSHLCHNTSCINVTHLVLEPHGFNNSRQTCVSKGECVGHIAPLPPCLVALRMTDNDLGIFDKIKGGGGQARGRQSLFILFFIFCIN